MNCGCADTCFQAREASLLSEGLTQQQSPDTPGFAVGTSCRLHRPRLPKGAPCPPRRSPFQPRPLLSLCGYLDSALSVGTQGRRGAWRTVRREGESFRGGREGREARQQKQTPKVDV